MSFVAADSRSVARYRTIMGEAGYRYRFGKSQIREPDKYFYYPLDADNGFGDIRFHLHKALSWNAVSQGLPSRLIAAAGNSGPNLDTINYPAAYYKVVSVAAIDSSDRVADFSSRGIEAAEFKEEERYLEVAAPGVSVESAYKDGCYAIWSGTSMATPHVSGLAAKLWQGSAGATRTYLQEITEDITLGEYAREGYDPAAGLGLPLVP